MTSVTINKNWKSETANGKSLAVVLFDNDIEVNYSGDVDNEFGKGDPAQLIRRNIRGLIRSRIVKSTVFQDVRIDSCTKGVQFKSVPVYWDSVEVGLKMPLDNSEVTLVNRRADYVLMLDYLRIGSQGQIDIGGAPTFSKTLEFSSRFVLWDNTQKCAVAYGYTHGKKGGGMFTGMDDWFEMADDMVQDIFRKPAFLLVTFDTIMVSDNIREQKLKWFEEKADLRKHKTKCLIANSITKNDPDSADIISYRSNKMEPKYLKQNVSKNFAYLPADVSGTMQDSESRFTRLFKARVSYTMAATCPCTEVMDDEPGKALQRQLASHFSRFDYPIDTLNQTTLDWARQDSTEYLIVYYTRFTQPGINDNAEDLDDNDANFYCNLIDLNNNITLTEYYKDLDDIFNYTTKAETLENAVETFLQIAQWKLRMRARW